MKIGDIARATGLTAHTLRYYERIGLLPFAARDTAGQRAYDPSILTWIAFLGRLKTTGMSIQEMLRYARLRARGCATGEERRQLLSDHRDIVRDRIAELQACLLVLDTKIAGYEMVRAAGPETAHDRGHQAGQRVGQDIGHNPGHALGHRSPHSPLPGVTHLDRRTGNANQHTSSRNKRRNTSGTRPTDVVGN